MEPPNHHPYNPPTAAWLPRGSCHQALWPSAFAAPGLQPALCLHRQPSSIAACPLPAHSPLLLGHSSLPFASLQALKPSAFAAPGLQPALCLHRQPSSIAACPLPAHSPLLLGHSSLPFASLQTLKTPKTLHRRCGTSKSPPLQRAMCRQRAGCNAGRLTVQAKRRLQPWSSKGWRPEGLVAAAARKPCSSWRIVRVVIWRFHTSGGGF